MMLGIALTFSAIAFAIHARQVRVQYQVWLRQIGQMTAVVVTDAQGVITWVSERFTSVTGYQFEEALGRTPSQLLYGADTDRTEAMRLEAAVRAGQPVAGELINHTKDGRAIWVGMKIQPLFDDLGTLLVSRGYEISHSFIDRMRNFGPGLLEEPVRVRISRT